MGKTIIIVVAAIALIGLVMVGGCFSLAIIGAASDSGESSSSSSTSVSKIPSEYILMDYTGKTQSSIASSYGYNTMPDSGKVFLIVSVKLENHGYEEFYVNPTNFELVVDNVAYDPDTATYSLDGYIDSLTLKNGGKTSGVLAFQIPKDSSNSYSLEYNSISWTDYNILSSSDILNFQ
ncbi:DUF4352 domain-containing protein [Methanococcus maripaludis]|nr:DUF4352 domain-containing protein [Methanococcus maripaludis]